MLRGISPASPLLKSYFFPLPLQYVSPTLCEYQIFPFFSRRFISLLYTVHMK